GRARDASCRPALAHLPGGAGEALIRPPHPRNPPSLGPCCPCGAARAGLGRGLPSAPPRCGGGGRAGSDGLPAPHGAVLQKRRPAMHTTLAAQLAQLELGHLTIDQTERPTTTEPPESEAVEQTLAAIWSE